MLRSFTSAAVACAVAGTITVFAQEPAPQAPAPQQPAASSATLTGCVQELKTTDGGTAFVLNNAEGGSAKMYVLIAQPSADVATHVNHKIEVTGQVQEPNPPPAPAEGAPANKNVVRPPIVQVESLKMVAESCK
jgi:hypothetical protein